MPGAFASDPVETFRRARLGGAVLRGRPGRAEGRASGVDRLLFGSDWPHAEGLAEPTDFAGDLRRHEFGEDEIRTVMSDNGRSLTVRATGAA